MSVATTLYEERRIFQMATSHPSRRRVEKRGVAVCARQTACLRAGAPTKGPSVGHKFAGLVQSAFGNAGALMSAVTSRKSRSRWPRPANRMPQCRRTREWAIGRSQLLGPRWPCAIDHRQCRRCAWSGTMLQFCVVMPRLCVAEDRAGTASESACSPRRLSQRGTNQGGSPLAVGVLSSKRAVRKPGRLL